MRRAAFEAGLIPNESSGRLELALEPEAACVACEAESAALAAGDAFMMLDCGGGTADITVHRVARAAPELRLDELRRPSGGPWGSAFVDAEFEAFLQRLVGGGAFRRLQASPCWVEAMRAWEAVKLGCDPGASLSGDAAKAISMSGVLEVARRCRCWRRGAAIGVGVGGAGRAGLPFGNLGKVGCQRRGGGVCPGPFLDGHLLQLLGVTFFLGWAVRRARRRGSPPAAPCARRGAQVVEGSNLKELADAYNARCKTSRARCTARARASVCVVRARSCRLWVLAKYVQ